MRFNAHGVSRENGASPESFLYQWTGERQAERAGLELQVRKFGRIAFVVYALVLGGDDPDGASHPETRSHRAGRPNAYLNAHFSGNV